MTTFTYGNLSNLNVGVTTDNDTYILGNGQGDFVDFSSFTQSNTGDTVILGNGAGDGVQDELAGANNIIIG